MFVFGIRFRFVVIRQSKAALARGRRERTSAFLDKQARKLMSLKALTARYTKATSPTVQQVKSVLRAKFLTEWQAETFAYLSRRSPQAAQWHAAAADWGRGIVAAHARLARQKDLKAARQASSAARFLHDGADGQHGGRRTGGTRAEFATALAAHPAARKKQAAVLAASRALRKAAARAVARDKQGERVRVLAKSAVAWRSALDAGNPGLAKAAWSATARVLRAALKLTLQRKPSRVRTMGVMKTKK